MENRFLALAILISGRCRDRSAVFAPDYRDTCSEASGSVIDDRSSSNPDLADDGSDEESANAIGYPSLTNFSAPEADEVETAAGSAVEPNPRTNRRSMPNFVEFLEVI